MDETASYWNTACPLHGVPCDALFDQSLGKAFHGFLLLESAHSSNILSQKSICIMGYNARAAPGSHQTRCLKGKRLFYSTEAHRYSGAFSDTQTVCRKTGMSLQYLSRTVLSGSLFSFKFCSSRRIPRMTLSFIFFEAEKIRSPISSKDLA